MSLEAKNIHVELGGRSVLDEASLEIKKGEIVAVAGANGAGKSTLLRAMAGLRAPKEGTVAIEGRDIRLLDRRALAREIAYLPQDRIVHWPVSVRTLVGLGRLPHRAPSAAESEKDCTAINAAMSAMDIDRFATRATTELSGGERARVLLARALAQEARFLIADEPASGLDPAHGLQLFQHFVRLARAGKGIAVALHDLSLAVRFCDRVALLKDGKVMVCGAPSDVVTEPHLAAAYGIRATIGHIDDLPVVLPVAPLP